MRSSSTHDLSHHHKFKTLSLAVLGVGGFILLALVAIKIPLNAPATNLAGKWRAEQAGETVYFEFFDDGRLIRTTSKSIEPTDEMQWKLVGDRLIVKYDSPGGIRERLHELRDRLMSFTSLRNFHGQEILDVRVINRSEIELVQSSQPESRPIRINMSRVAGELSARP